MAQLRRFMIPSRPSAFPRWIAAAALVALAVAAYTPALQSGFIWDDDSILTGNPLVQAPDGLRRLWLTTEPTDYWPVTMTSFWIEWRLWGAGALGYHAVNLGLHIASCFLFWAVLRRLGLGYAGAAMAALLFAVHPVNVESVAWVTQRKNELAMVFYLGSIACFLRAIAPERDTPGNGRRPWVPGYYCLSLLAFTLAMLSKGSVAFLPLVLAGIVVWRRRFTWRDLYAFLPFVVVAAVLTGVNLWFQGRYLAAGEPLRSAGLLERLLGAGGVIWFYLAKAVLPIGLSFEYPSWRIAPGDWRWWLPDLAALAMTIALAAGARRSAGSRAAFFGWLYFGVALIPVLGLTDVTYMRYSPVADHYQHLALLGVAALAGAGWAWLREKSRSLDLVAAAVVAALTVLTWKQASTYRDSETLYRETLARNPAAWMVENNLGSALVASGRLGEAIDRYADAARIAPTSAEIRCNLGYALARAGRWSEAYDSLVRAVALDPGYAPAQNDLGNVLLAVGRPADAVAHFQAALRLRPGDAPCAFNLALALERAGRPAEAAAAYAEVLRLQPNFPGAREGLARNASQRR